MAVGKNFMWKKGKGEAIIFLIMLKLYGKISCEEEGKRTEILGKIIKIRNIEVWKKIKLQGTLYSPDHFYCLVGAEHCDEGGSRGRGGPHLDLPGIPLPEQVLKPASV